MPVSQIILLFAVLLSGAGVFLVFRGYFAPRDGVDLHCRRCGYNLRGRDPKHLRCAECGADLEARRATTLGRRIVHWNLVLAGLACLIFGIPPLAAQGMLRFGHIDAAKYKPFWMLHLEAESRDPEVELLALTELNRRLPLNTLTPAQMNELAESAMEAGNSGPRRVAELWEAIYGALSRRGGVPNAMLARHLAAKLRPKLIIRPKVRDGDPIPFGFGYNAVGNLIDPHIWLVEGGAVISVGPIRTLHPLDRDALSRDVRGQFALGDASRVRARGQEYPWFCLDPSRYHGKLSPGLHTMRATLTIDTVAPSGKTVTLSFDCTGDFELVPADQPTVSVAGSLQSPTRPGIMIVNHFTLHTPLAPRTHDAALKFAIRSSAGTFELQRLIVPAGQSSIPVLIKDPTDEQLSIFVCEGAEMIIEPDPELTVRSLALDSCLIGSVVIPLRLGQKTRAFLAPPATKKAE